MNPSNSQHPNTFSFQDHTTNNNNNNNNMTNGFFSAIQSPTNIMMNPSLPTTTTAPPTTTSFLDLNFASEVPMTTTSDNQLYQNMLQAQTLKYQTNQMMFGQRRDSISSSGTKRVQTKAEKRAEHNATERQRRENLNSRFQQLAHLLPNLQHDTRPSKGTIIDRTLDFVKNALQKEERYRNEIKELRHTNRQLLKHIHYITTGEKETMMDSEDDQLSEKSISTPPPASPVHSDHSSHLVHRNNNNNNNNNHTSKKEILYMQSPGSSPSPSLITSPLPIKENHSPTSMKSIYTHTTTNNNNTTNTNTINTNTNNNNTMFNQKQSFSINHPTSKEQKQFLQDQKLLKSTHLIQQESFPHSSPLKPLSSFSSEVWHQPTTTYWSTTTPTTTPTHVIHQPSQHISYSDADTHMHASIPNSSMNFMNPTLVQHIKPVDYQDQMKLMQQNVKTEYLDSQPIDFQVDSQLNTRITSRPTISTTMDTFSHLSFK
ncbi:unnamed protein product [Cunninghamella blakesleeana]